MERVFDTPRSLTLRIDLPAGEAFVDGEQTAQTLVGLEPLDDAARAVVDAVRIELREYPEGDVLAVEIPERRGFFGRNPHFALHVRCPEGTSVEARTRSAGLAGRGVLGAVRAKTASGDVTIEQALGNVEIQTASGDVEVGSARAETSVTTASGDVSVDTAFGPVQAHVVSGDVTVEDALDAVEANSVSGDVRLEAVGPGSVRAKSVSGDIRIAVRRGYDVWLDVNTLSGDTASELEPSTGPDASDGDPLVELRAKTVSGDVEIVRAAATAGERGPAAEPPPGAAAGLR